MRMLIAIATTVLMSACGADYNASPIVLSDDHSDVIILDEPNTTATFNNPNDLFTQTQLGLLINTTWQSRCINQQRSVMTFDQLDRTTRIYDFSDSTCTTLANENPVVIVEPYEPVRRIITDSGIEAHRIDFRTPVAGEIVMTRDLFRVERNRLYFGLDSGAMNYPTDLDFDRVWYASNGSDVFN